MLRQRVNSHGRYTEIPVVEVRTVRLRLIMEAMLQKVVCHSKMKNKLK